MEFILAKVCHRHLPSRQTGSREFWAKMSSGNNPPTSASRVTPLVSTTFTPTCKLDSDSDEPVREGEPGIQTTTRSYWEMGPLPSGALFQPPALLPGLHLGLSHVVAPPSSVPLL